mgnify:CR=1 FL=1
MLLTYQSRSKSYHQPEISHRPHLKNEHPDDFALLELICSTLRAEPKIPMKFLSWMTTPRKTRLRSQMHPKRTPYRCSERKHRSLHSSSACERLRRPEEREATTLGRFAQQSSPSSYGVTTSFSCKRCLIRLSLKKNGQAHSST